jgi:hypothetical protein
MWPEAMPPATRVSCPCAYDGAVPLRSSLDFGADERTICVRDGADTALISNRERPHARRRAWGRRSSERDAG